MSGHPEIPQSKLTKLTIGGVDYTDQVHWIELTEPSEFGPVVTMRAAVLAVAEREEPGDE